MGSENLSSEVGDWSRPSSAVTQGEFLSKSYLQGHLSFPLMLTTSRHTGLLPVHCFRAFVLAVCSARMFSPRGLHKPGSFSSFGLNVTTSKKPSVTTSPHLASPTPLYHMRYFIIFIQVIKGYLKLTFYLFVYSLMISVFRT